MENHKARASAYDLLSKLVTRPRTLHAVTGSLQNVAGREKQQDAHLTQPVLILIAAHGSAEKLRACLDSLVRHAPANCTVAVLDDATPDDSVSAVCHAVKRDYPELLYLRSSANRGFVRTCNWGLEELWRPGSDLLLLNSDTEVTSGFLQEMQAVLHLHEKHAVATPRSNNATVFSVPYTGGLSGAESYRLWQDVRHLLPRYHVAPTAVGFCMLIKGEVLERFKLFDEAYGLGYNEENDFVCRINRYGYSAIAANWAFVFHDEGASFGLRRVELKKTNDKILSQRYPEYEQKVQDYLKFSLDPVEYFSALMRPHRFRILFDFYNFVPAHNGTTEVALNLLREIARLVEDEFDVYVGIRSSATWFASELVGYRLHTEKSGPLIVDLVFRPAQIFSWMDYQRMNRFAPRISYTLLDIIGVRCDYLNSPSRQMLFRKTAELSDRVFTISDFSRADFATFYNADIPLDVVHLGTNYESPAGCAGAGHHILLIGNQYIHKAVEDTLDSLGPDFPVVVLGGSNDRSSRPNVKRLKSGALTRHYVRQLYLNAKAVIYPSHYEGFGLPVLDALALGRPTIVLDTAVNRELDSITCDENLYRIRSMNNLRQYLQEILVRGSRPSDFAARKWKAVAQEYVDRFRQMLATEIDVPKLRARWDFLRVLESLDHHNS